VNPLNALVESTKHMDVSSLFDGRFSADGSMFVIGDMDGRVTLFGTQPYPDLAAAPFFQYFK